MIHLCTTKPGRPSTASSKPHATAPRGFRSFANLHFPGYSETDLPKLPKVTTETGCVIDKNVPEGMQALNLMSLYPDQFKRGWSYTSAYLLRDRTDESGNQTFGFHRRDYSPRKAAVYLHNLTTILADSGASATPGRLDSSIPDEPGTVHYMLLQCSDGAFQLIVGGERLTGEERVVVRLGGTHALVKVYDPTSDIEPVKTYDNVDSLDLVLSDHPLIVMIP